MYFGVAFVLVYITGLVRSASICPYVQAGALLWQIITGHSEKVNVALWDHVNLIWITFLFSFIMDIWRFDNKWAVFGFIVLGAVSMKYSGVNW